MTSVLPSLFPLFAAGDGLRIFGFEFYVSILVGCLYLAGSYYLLTGPARRKYGWAPEGPSIRQQVFWYGAVGVIFLALNGPLHEMSDEYLFSAHMIQHILIMLIMPPFLIMGLPDWLVRRAIQHPVVYRVGRFLTHPATAWVFYNVVFIGWHIPGMYNAALINHNVHIVQHLTFMAAAVMMWWPVINPVPELQRIPDGPLQMMYLFAFGVPSTIVAAFITLSDVVFYPWYAVAPRVSGLGPLEDQRLGGLIMWIPGMLIFWVGITAIFFRWTKDEVLAWGEDPEDRVDRAPEDASIPEVPGKS
jgi:putative membrane protein